MLDIEKLKYPIGKPTIPKEITPIDVELWIDILTEFPLKMAKEVLELSNKELSYQYRPNGWNIQQVVNHCIDSHINSYIRFKLALTEENPTIKPYQESLWAELADTVEYNIQESIALLNGIHKRWVFLLKSLSNSDLNKIFIHPEGNEKISLKENLGIYAWHCEHHLAHVLNAKEYQYAE